MPTPFSSLEHSAGPEADVSEGVGCGAVPTRSQDLHRGHVQPAGQPAVRFPPAVSLRRPRGVFGPLPWLMMRDPPPSPPVSLSTPPPPTRSAPILFIPQRLCPEPSRQIVLHHVRVLAGPSLLDEVGTQFCLLFFFLERISPLLPLLSETSSSCLPPPHRVSAQLPAVVHQ